MSRNFVTSRSVVALLGTSLSGCALLNASLSGSRRFRCGEMFENVHVLLLNTPCFYMCNRHEQRPSNQGDVDFVVTGEIGRIYYIGVDLFLI